LGDAGSGEFVPKGRERRCSTVYDEPALDATFSVRAGAENQCGSQPAALGAAVPVMLVPAGATQCGCSAVVELAAVAPAGLAAVAPARLAAVAPAGLAAVAPAELPQCA